jgi:hypothetical protein
MRLRDRGRDLHASTTDKGHGNTDGGQEHQNVTATEITPRTGELAASQFVSGRAPHVTY